MLRVATYPPREVRHGFRGFSQHAMEQLVYHYVSSAPRGAAVTAHWITYVVGGMGKEDVLRVQQTIYRLQRKRKTIYYDALLEAYLPKNPEDPVPAGRIRAFAPRRPRSERIPGKLRPKLTRAQKRKRDRLWKKQQQSAASNVEQPSVEPPRGSPSPIERAG